MSYIADRFNHFKEWDYITGKFHEGRCISVFRWRHLQGMDNVQKNFKVALRDPQRPDAWTKWQGIYGWDFDNAFDVHRSVLDNEIIIESDYPTYEENAEAARIVGKIVESKGFVPHYYYSGNKSVHIHIFLDWTRVMSSRSMFTAQIEKLFGGNEDFFKKRFIEWLRLKMITCWDTNVRKFDAELVHASHLIRCEMSRNKMGYKTFLGYSYRDVAPIPIVCNEDNGIYPVLGKIVLSAPSHAEELMQEFLSDIDKKRKLKQTSGLGKWVDFKDRQGLRDCVKFMMSEDFKKAKDGFNRAMFILCNELKKQYGADVAKTMMYDWNDRMCSNIPRQEIDYRLSQKEYSLSCEYIHEFLTLLNLDFSQKCKCKI